MGERHVRVERRVEGQDLRLQLPRRLVEVLEVGECSTVSRESVHAGIDRGVQGPEPRVRDVPVLEGRGASRSLQQIIRPQDVVAEHPDDRRDQLGEARPRELDLVYGSQGDRRIRVRQDGPDDRLDLRARVRVIRGLNVQDVPRDHTRVEEVEERARVADVVRLLAPSPDGSAQGQGAV